MLKQIVKSQLSESVSNKLLGDLKKGDEEFIDNVINLIIVSEVDEDTWNNTKKMNALYKKWKNIDLIKN